jgi:hypothetical protein
MKALVALAACMFGFPGVCHAGQIAARPAVNCARGIRLRVGLLTPNNAHLSPVGLGVTMLLANFTGDLTLI